MNQTIKNLNDQIKPNYSGISASSLNWYDISPLYFKKKLDKEIEDPLSKAAELGIQLHMYLLEHEKFNDTYLTLTFDKPKGENQIKFCQRCAELKLADPELTLTQVAIPSYKAVYKTDSKSENKITEEATNLYAKLEPYIRYLTEKDGYQGIISQSGLYYLKEARYAVKSHDKAAQLMFDDTSDFIDNPDIFSANELRIYWEHPEITLNGKPLVLKSIIDRLYIDHKEKTINLIDVKTSNSLYNFKDKFKEYNYKRQMAFYWYAIQYIFPKLFPDKEWKDYDQQTFIVAIQTPDPIKRVPTECKVVEVDIDTIAQGKEEVDSYLQDIAWHMETGQWKHTKEYYEQFGIDLIV